MNKEIKKIRYLVNGETAEMEARFADVLLKVGVAEEIQDPDPASKLDTLKAEADSLGIQYAYNIKEATLEKKIQDHKNASTH